MHICHYDQEVRVSVKPFNTFVYLLHVIHNAFMSSLHRRLPAEHYIALSGLGHSQVSRRAWDYTT